MDDLAKQKSNDMKSKERIYLEQRKTQIAKELGAFYPVSKI